MAKKVRLDIKATGAEKAARSVGRVDKGLGKLAKSAAGVAAGFFGARMLIQGFQNVVELTKQQVLAEAQLNAVLKSTKNVAGLTAKELVNMASALQKQTRFGDEAIMTAQSLMLTFTKVGKDVFPAAIETVMNMSEAMGQDMKQSVIQVGKALNDPIMGVTALRRVGVQLSEEQEQSVRDFMAVNDVASAQKIILGELETQFGGVAKAAGSTMAGSLEQMSNAVGDAQQALGRQLAPVIILMATKVTTLANKTEEFFKNLSPENIDAIKRNAIALATMATSFVMLTSASLLARKGMLAFIRASKFLLVFEAFDLIIANVTSNIDWFKKKLLELQLSMLQFATGPIGQAFMAIPGFINPAAAAFKNAVDSIVGDGTLPEAMEELQNQINNTQTKAFEFDWGNLAVMFGGEDGLEGVNTEKIKKELEELEKAFGSTGGKLEEIEKETLKESLENMMISGAATKENAISTIKAKSKEATGSYIADIMKTKSFPLNLILAALANQVIDKLFQPLMKFPTGGSFVTNKKTTLPIGNGIVVGDNANAMEQIDITPLPSPNQRSSGNITININAPVVDEYVVDSIIPAIERARKLNL